MLYAPWFRPSALLFFLPSVNRTISDLLVLLLLKLARLMTRKLLRLIGFSLVMKVTRKVNVSVFSRFLTRLRVIRASRRVIRSVRARSCSLNLRLTKRLVRSMRLKIPLLRLRSAMKNLFASVLLFSMLVMLTCISTMMSLVMILKMISMRSSASYIIFSGSSTTDKL